MKLVPDTPLKMTISVALAVTGFTASVTWLGANGLRDIKDEIASLRSELHVQNQLAWTRLDMERWSHALDRANRFTSLNVPPVQDDKAKKKN